MHTYPTTFWTILFALTALSSTAFAQNTQSDTPPQKEGHGPSSSSMFSHNFTLAPHTYDLQWNIHFGLSQPLLFNGFNIASDLRVNRWVFEYSHGMNLDYSANPTVRDQILGKDSSLSMTSPWTTGFGVGYTLIDDLYIMTEFKAHRYEVSAGSERTAYTTVSVGPAIAYRLFLYRGLNLTGYLRWWPNVWESTPDDTITVGEETHDVTDLGFFANLSLGWAFDL